MLLSLTKVGKEVDAFGRLGLPMVSQDADLLARETTLAPGSFCNLRSVSGLERLLPSVRLGLLLLISATSR